MGMNNSCVLNNARFVIFNNYGKDVTRNVHDAFHDLICTKDAPEIVKEYRRATKRPNEKAKIFLRLTNGKPIKPEEVAYLSSVPFEYATVCAAEFREDDPRSYAEEIIYHLWWNNYLDGALVTSKMYYGFFDAESYDESQLGIAASKADDTLLVVEYNIG